MAEHLKIPISKSLFVFITIGFCLIVAAYMAFDPELTTKVAEIVADGFISLAMFLAVSFLASSSVDYSGILHKIGGRRVAMVDAAPEAVTTALNPQEVKG